MYLVLKNRPIDDWEYPIDAAEESVHKYSTLVVTRNDGQ